MLEVVLAAGPMALPLWAVLAFSAAMYPLGFLFGVCSECCCSNTSCEGFDLDEAYSFQASPTSEMCNVTAGSGSTALTVPRINVGNGVQEGCKVTGANIPPGTYITERDTDYATQITTLTISNATLGAIDGCVNVCGASGVCGPFSNIPGQGGIYGPYGVGVVDGECGEGSGGFTPRRRRACVRWVCRCYQATEQIGSENPAEWFTVTSTTTIGGPTVNDLNLTDELEAAQFNGSPLEFEVFYYLQGIGIQPGETRCLVWAFVFYAISDYIDRDPSTPRRFITPDDDCYEVDFCDRCN